MEPNKTIATPIIIIVTLMLVFLFVVPKFHQSQGLDVSLAKKQAEYDGRSLYYASLADALTSLQNRQEALKKVESALPDEDSLAPLLAFFQQQGQTSSVSVASVAFAQDEPMAIAKTLPNTGSREVKDVKLVVELDGSYQGLKRFLQALENSSRLIEVASVSLSPVQSLQSGASRQPNYHVVLEVITHTY